MVGQLQEFGGRVSCRFSVWSGLPRSIAKWARTESKAASGSIDRMEVSGPAARGTEKRARAPG